MKKILILAANPRKDLNLDREIRDLKRIIESSQDSEDFEVVNELAVRVSDLQDLLFKYRPQIVHFCGHGGGELGLMFESDSGREQQVETAALSDLFRLFANNVECVLLNACYSETQANSIVEHINYVIGMNQAIRDDAAIAFAKGFYRALGYSCAIEEAFEFGCNAIQLEISGSAVARSEGSAVERKLKVVNKVESTAIPEHLKPKLKKKSTLSAVAEAPVISPEQRLVLQSVIDASVKPESAVKSESDRGQKPHKKSWWMIGGVALGLLVLLGGVGSRLLLPGMARSAVQTGQEKFKSGDSQKAEADYQWAIKLDPDNPPAHLHLGILYESAQQLESARVHYAIAARQNEFTAVNHLARLYLLEQQNNEAVGLLTNALKAENQFDRAIKEETKYGILTNLGWANLQQGKYSNAADDLEKAIAIKQSVNLDEQFASLAAPHCLLAQVHEALKKPKEALEEWAICLDYKDSSKPEEEKWAVTAQQKIDVQNSKNTKPKKSN
jgi:tetratricopeptide (TPR) repeat protein